MRHGIYHGQMETSKYIKMQKRRKLFPERVEKQTE